MDISTASSRNVSAWSRAEKFDGLAYGWTGGAWVWLQLAHAGLIRDNDRVREAIFRRLQKAITVAPPTLYSSHLIGTGAIPVIAAMACGQDDRLRRVLPQAIRWWDASCRASQANDVMLGAAGALLASAEIESYVPGSIPKDLIRTLHPRCETALKRGIESSRSKPVYLGLSHGLAGYILALESVQAAFHLPFKTSLRTQGFDRIMEESFEGPGQSAIWTEHSGAAVEDIHYVSWCHGSPGISLAFLICYKLTGMRKYWSAAKMGLAGSLAFPVCPIFCCGAAGIAQILLETYRHTRDIRWLKKAKMIARQADAMKPPGRKRKNFHYGTLGMEYLSWRLAHPEKLPLLGLGLFSHS